ncbi:hypothetical protein ACM16X_21000 [Haloarcula japonica]|uniref:hypothetical protein n=1 Tax=Haloarcula japonica TaxID=29282 RepID=UPI0039F6589D
MSDDDSEDDPLDDIFVDGDAINREMVSKLLEPYLQIDQESGSFYPTDGYKDLNSEDKILVTLTAQRAKEIRGLVDSSAIGPSEISDLSGVKEGTVKPGVRDLAEEGLITNTEEGYTIGGPQLQQAAERLLSEE